MRQQRHAYNQRDMEPPAAARNFDAVSRFPHGESRAGRVPPTPDARCAPANGADTHRCCRLPPQEGWHPLARSPDWLQPMGYLPLVPLSRMIAREKNKDGRHVGLDFYDLLIEAFKNARMSFNSRLSSTRLAI